MTPFVHGVKRESFSSSLRKSFRISSKKNKYKYTTQIPESKNQVLPSTPPNNHQRPQSKPKWIQELAIRKIELIECFNGIINDEESLNRGSDLWETLNQVSQNLISNIGAPSYGHVSQCFNDSPPTTIMDGALTRIILSNIKPYASITKYQLAQTYTLSCFEDLWPSKNKESFISWKSELMKACLLTTFKKDVNRIKSSQVHPFSSCFWVSPEQEEIYTCEDDINKNFRPWPPEQKYIKQNLVPNDLNIEKKHYEWLNILREKRSHLLNCMLDMKPTSNTYESMKFVVNTILKMENYGYKDINEYNIWLHKQKVEQGKTELTIQEFKQQMNPENIEAYWKYIDPQISTYEPILRCFPSHINIPNQIIRKSVFGNLKSLAKLAIALGRRED